MTGPRPRTEMALALGLVVLGALAVLAGAGQPRAALSGAAGRVTGTEVGDAATPAAGALALVALAGVAAALLLRPGARRLVGTLLLPVAVGIVLVSWSRPDGAGWSAFTGDAETVRLVRSGWAWLMAAGGVAVGAGGALTAVRAGRWPAPRSRYERETVRRHEPERDSWEALDRGEDPTA